MSSDPSSSFRTEEKHPTQFGIGAIIATCVTCMGLAAVCTVWMLGPSAENAGDADTADVWEPHLKSDDVPEETSPDSAPPTRKPATAVTNDSSDATVLHNEGDDILTYQMNVGDEHIYRLSITAGKLTRRPTKRQCTYKVMNGTKSKWNKAEASGTAFVVAANGYLATCAHVVARASKVEVVLNEKTYTATVVAQNPLTDLAVLKIDADNLSICGLGDSDHVELTETVRAFGYPLSTVLGTDLKAVTGSVSGLISDPTAGRRIQTDASINPGNSGGPLVNDFGQVIGIASSKLKARTASSVGLAVPVNELRKMLTKIEVSFPQMTVSKQLSGPEIARSVKTSVAFVRTEGFQGKVFDVNFRLDQPYVAPGMRPMGLSAFLGRGRQPGEMKINEFGEVVEQKGDPGVLPFALGTLNQFCLIPLDYLGRRTWSTERHMLLQIEDGPTDLLSALMDHHLRNAPRLSPFGQPRNEQPARMTAAEEVTKFERLDSDDDSIIKIRRTYRLATLDNEDTPGLEVKGSGEILFSKSAGVPISGNYTGEVISNSNGRQDVTPVKVEFEHFSGKELAAQQKAIAEENERKSTTETTVTENPDGTKTTVTITKSPAGTRTTTVITGPGKSSSSTTFKSTSSGTRSGTAKPKAPAPKPKELTDAELDELVMKLNSHSGWVRALGQLKKMGARAEESVLRQLPKFDWSFGKTQAYGLLGKIGTEASKPFLKKAADEGDIWASNALRDIERRERK